MSEVNTDIMSRRTVYLFIALIVSILIALLYLVLTRPIPSTLAGNLVILAIFLVTFNTLITIRLVLRRLGQS